MSINCKDFLIKKPDVRYVYFKPEDVMGEVNDWISGNDIKVINVETITQQSIDDFKVRAFFHGVRVWYEVA